jgi:hypothetical protein
MRSSVPKSPRSPRSKDSKGFARPAAAPITPTKASAEPIWLFPALIAVLLLAFLLRIYGIGFGLPHLYYWDEPTVVNRAVRFGSGDLNPHFFAYPALYMYVLFAVSGLTFLLGRATGHYHNAQDFAAEYFLDPSRVYLSVRLATACIGTLTVWLTYLVGKKYFNERVGLVGALFMAVSVVNGSHSHAAITDVPHVLFIVAACLPLHDVLTRGRRRDYVLSGLLIGLGAATKYLAVLLVPTLLFAAWLSTRRSALSSEQADPPQNNKSVSAPRSPLISLAFAFAALLAGFFVGTPFNILNLRAFLADIETQRTISQGSGKGTGYWFYVSKALPGDMGGFVFLAALIGILLLLWKRKSVGGLFLTFPLVYFVFIGRYPVEFSRYMLPEGPFLALLAAYALNRLYETVRDRLTRRKKSASGSGWKWAWALSVLALALPPLWLLLQWDSLMANTPDTRTLALQWVERNVPVGSAISVQTLNNRTYFNAPILTDRGIARIADNIPQRGKLAQVRERVVATLKQRPVYHEVPWNEAHPDFDALMQAGAEYVIVTDAHPPLSPDLEHRFEARAGVINKPILRFSPGALGDQMAGGLPVWPPHITIYPLR